ncbi:MAG: hypothetical protein M3081_08510 [Gemmatimonadota bacterium]|nr:hypothetical protein [Gemmatimonadota bacterium]
MAIQPGIETSPRGIVGISIVFIVFGIVVFFLSLSAIRTGKEIELLSHDRRIGGYEGMLIAFGGVLVGVGGIWAVRRMKK